MRARFERKLTRHSLVDFPGLLSLGSRQDNPEHGVEVSGLAGRNPTPFDAQLLPLGRARRDLEIDRPGGRRHVHTRTESRLPRCNRKIDIEVPSDRSIARAWIEMDLEKKFAGRQTPDTGRTLAFRPNALVFRNPHRNSDIEG